MTRECRDCGSALPLDMFPRNRNMKDGRLNSCRQCRSSAHADWRSKNRKKCIERCREWHARNPGRGAERYRADPERHRQYQRDARDRHPEKIAARNAASNAILAGKMIRGSCLRCGSDRDVEAHHWSYDREHRLDVTWLCRKCHCRAHRIIRERYLLMGEDSGL